MPANLNDLAYSFKVTCQFPGHTSGDECAEKGCDGFTRPLLRECPCRTESADSLGRCYVKCELLPAGQCGVDCETEGCQGAGLVPLTPAERHMALEEALRGMGYEVEFRPALDIVGFTPQVRIRKQQLNFTTEYVDNAPTWPLALEAAALQLPECKEAHDA